MRPTNLSRFKLPTRRLERSCDALVDFIARHWSMLAACAIFAIYAGVSDSQYQELAAADKRAAEDAIAQRDELIAYTARKNVRVTLEGDAQQVATLAGQVAVVVK